MNQFPLTRMAPGVTARVAGVRSTNGAFINKLAALGVLPGLPITLIQTYPAYLVQIGQSELAMDRETARCIEVII